MSISPKNLYGKYELDRSNAPVICDFCYHGNKIITPHQPLHCVNVYLETIAK